MKKIVIFALLLIGVLSMSLTKGKGIPRPNGQKKSRVTRPVRYDNINDKGHDKGKCGDCPIPQ